MKIENLNNSSGPLWTHFEDNSITTQDNYLIFFLILLLSLGLNVYKNRRKKFK
jgi:hypothetical protein